MGTVEETAYRRITAELEKRHTTWRKLADVLEISDQLLHNWQSKQSVPMSRYWDIADVLGWSVDRVMGREEGPSPLDFSDYALRAAIFIDGLQDDDERARALATLEFHFRRPRSGTGQAAASPNAERPPIVEPVPLRKPSRLRKNRP